MTVITQFQKKIPLIETQKLLAPLTTFQTGGPADLYYEIKDNKQLPQVIELARENQLNYYILGGGSNTIFSDQGFRGLIIHMKSREIEIQKDILILDAGVLLSQVIQTSLKNNLSGMEKMMGLPGTIGGAVRGNAGAFGVETKDFFLKAVIYNPQNGLQTVDSSYFKFGYRESALKHNNDIILKVFLKLEQKDCTEALKEALNILKSRAGTQPSGKCSGSFFKNPDLIHKAGALLDQVGCKNLQAGQAKVSDKHANWIMNLGSATQQDVLELSRLMQQKVKDQFGIHLQREVQLVGIEGLFNA